MGAGKRLGFGADSHRNNLLALLLILLVFAALGLRFWAEHHKSLYGGPQQITQLGDALLINNGDALYRISPSGEILSRHDLSQLGYANNLTDLHGLPDGSVLLASSRPSTVRQCRLETSDCDTLLDPGQLPEGRAYKLLHGPDGTLMIADTSGHRILRVQDLRNPEPTPLDITAGLRFPNQLSWHNGQLWVADTNHHRLSAYHVNEVRGEMLGSIEVIGHPDARRTRIWPTAFAFDERGRVWVIVANNLLRDADVLAYSLEGRALTRIELPEGADPVFMTHHQGALFITDPTRMTVHQVDMNDLRVSALGGQFGTLLDELRTQRDHYATLSHIGLWSLAGILVLGLLLASGSLRERLSKQWQATMGTGSKQHPHLSNRIAPLVNADRLSGVSWLEPDPKRMRPLQWALYAGMACILLAPALIIATQVYWAPEDADASPYTFRGLMAMLLVLVAVILPLMWQASLLLKSRIGIRGGLLYLRDHRGRAIQIPAEVAVSSPMHISHGPITVVLFDGRGKSYYDEETTENTLKPIVARTHHLGHINFWLYQLKQRQTAAILAAVLPLSGVLALYAILKWL
ncbi:hypothetical protein [Thioalkalivibrio sulfidiphilus]|uniref:hypothetical protein n=1 Tax=Thioalkalivibrio sulfidiphilus TaxID=1033854 RepID=UPI000361D823|nr:hypothetical protein [Thioalkalivibrio sulfidiphilus]